MCVFFQWIRSHVRFKQLVSYALNFLNVSSILPETFLLFIDKSYGLFIFISAISVLLFFFFFSMWFLKPYNILYNITWRLAVVRHLHTKLCV